MVDTTRPAARPGGGWDGADGVADVLLVDLVEGRTTPLTGRGRRRAGRAGVQAGT
ncbi:hypothetical protein ACIBO5_17585 [Nonomuraea angiospora]|uniref:hypothetical protein n=1 Tax=Nonomuraea angiospora TaxID=46172 RepID=UPI0029BBA2B3|nr:hypothetical protein [Nonomuraea angiospora]MDX3109087.1 hypothetical protein [Nonomuraea angiospora]